MLFDYIPQNFFQPLASLNKKLYWECIYKLYTIMNHHLSFGVLKEIVIDELAYYFDTIVNSQIEEDGEEALMSSRDKASYTYRKLLECGWLAKEDTNSYEQRIHFNDYAIDVIKTLIHIANNDKMEYQGYVYTIYTLLRSNTKEKGVILNQVYENTDKLMTGLKNLNTNIKKYIDQLTRYETIKEIMEVLFEDYRVNIVDKAYHRLKTSDNVSKYRPAIVEKLEDNMKDEAYITQAAKGTRQLQDLISDEEAKEKVLDMLREIRDAFNNMDEILDEIDYKNSSYQRSAINRAKFILSYGEDVSGQIKEILIYMGDQIANEEIGLSTIYELDYLESLFTLYSSSFYDEESLYTPIEGKKTFKPTVIEEVEVDPLKRQEKMRQMAQKLQRTMSAAYIEQYVTSVLKGKKVMLASDFPLNTMEDFIKLIYIRLYGQRKRIRYRIVSKGDIYVKGYRFRNFEIWEKEI
jgi:hypothetical protein